MRVCVSHFSSETRTDKVRTNKETKKNFCGTKMGVGRKNPDRQLLKTENREKKLNERERERERERQEETKPKPQKKKENPNKRTEKHIKRSTKKKLPSSQTVTGSMILRGCYRGRMDRVRQMRERERDGGRGKQTRDMISQEQNSKRKTKVEGRKARTDGACSRGFDPGTAPTLTSPTQVPCVCFRSRHFQDLVGCVRLSALLDSACEKLERGKGRETMEEPLF